MKILVKQTYIFYRIPNFFGNFIIHTYFIIRTILRLFVLSVKKHQSQKWYDKTMDRLLKNLSYSHHFGFKIADFQNFYMFKVL